jgi:hypothetical protein
MKSSMNDAATNIEVVWHQEVKEGSILTSDVWPMCLPTVPFEKPDFVPHVFNSHSLSDDADISHYSSLLHVLHL